jgi:hypothetical protein
MTNMNDLKKRYSELNDYELLNIVYFESDDYRKEAVDIAKSILLERGLGNPSEETLVKAKKHRVTPVSAFDDFKENIYGNKKLSKAVKKKDYLFIGKWLFWIVFIFAIFDAMRGYSNIERDWLPPFFLFFMEIFLTLAIFGIIPITFFIFYSLNLSKEQRRKKKLSLLMPKYVFFLYGFSLFLFFALIILPRL